MNPRREPALWIGAIATFLNLAVVIGLGDLTTEQAALIVAAITALAGLVAAFLTRPIALGVVTGALGAMFALFAGFGYEASPEVIGAINAALLAFLTFVFRGQVTPAPVLARRPDHAA